MSIWDVLSGGLSNPAQLAVADLDPTTMALIDQQVSQGQASQDQIIQNELHGTSATMPSATGGAVAQQQSALGGADNAAVTQALNNRASRLYASQYGQLQGTATAQAPILKSKLMAQGIQGLQDQQNIANEISRQQMQAQVQQQQIRNQVIGQLFGGAGKFAGMYAAAGGFGGGNGENIEQEENQYSGNPYDPNFMGPPAPAAAMGDRSMMNSWAGPDSGIGMGRSFEGLG